MTESSQEQLAQHKTNNPFVNVQDSPYNLKNLPFKTSDRIFSDLRLTPRIFVGTTSYGSFLRTKCIDYAKFAANLPNSYDAIILNNSVDFVPSVENSHGARHVRGLLVLKSGPIFHFKISLLIASTSVDSVPPIIDKHEYHVVDKSMVGSDRLTALGEESRYGENLVEDVFYKSLNCASHVLRVSVYSAEFSEDDIRSLVDAELVVSRYQKWREKTGMELSLSIEPITCITTLIKVLKGPILLPKSEHTQTINREKTSLDAKIDVSLLFDKLSFTSTPADEDTENLVPPNLAENPALLESYIRKAYELLFLARSVKTTKQNDFDKSYSYSDNMSQAFAILGEYDKLASTSSFRNDASNRYAHFISLSCSAFYQDELVIRCFEKSVASDPSNRMHYIDCFRQIMSFRSSSTAGKLQSYYQNQYRKGNMYGTTQYISALSAIGITGISADDPIDDEVVLGLYKEACRNDPKNYSYFNEQIRVISAVKNSFFLKNSLKNELVPMRVALDELRIEEVTEDDVAITAFELRLDEVLQDANFNTESPDIKLLNRCFLSLAVNRKSYILMNYIERKMPSVVELPVISLTELASILEVSKEASDFEIILKFQEKLTLSEIGDTAAFFALRESLRVLAEEKKSEILFRFLHSGQIDSSLLPAEDWPAGLDNIGNTCYLNSLLQYYFCIKPLRETILSFDDSKVMELKGKKRKVGGRNVEDLELLRSAQFILRLQALFKEMITTRKRCVQPTKELAYLSFLPLSRGVEFKDPEASAEGSKPYSQTESSEYGGFYPSSGVSKPYSEGHKDSSEVSKPYSEAEASEGPETKVSGSESALDSEAMDEDPTTALENDKENSKAANSEADAEELPSEFSSEVALGINDSTKSNFEAPTLGFNELTKANSSAEASELLSISDDQMDSTIEVGRQQDVTECIENVTFQIETALEPENIEQDGEQFDMIKKLFCGETKQTIIPLDEEGNQKQSRSSIERFFSLIINVSDHPKSIYDSLDTYFSQDVMNLEEGTAQKLLTISKLPEIMQFHVQRVLFDREKLMAYKSLEVIPFSETIYLDRYLDTEDPEIIRKRTELHEWKEKMRHLHEEKDACLAVDSETNLSPVDALKATKKYLEQKNAPVHQATLDVITEQIDHLKGKLTRINAQLAELQSLVSSQFSGYKNVPYTLFAIFIHRGEASYGHYWVYIRDIKRNVYRKYNDDSVTEVPASEVFDFTENNTATPYFMVYVKDELKDSHVEPLKRILTP